MDFNSFGAIVKNVLYCNGVNVTDEMIGSWWFELKRIGIALPDREAFQVACDGMILDPDFKPTLGELIKKLKV